MQPKIDSSDGEIEICARRVQLKKADPPKKTTEEGIIILVNDWHSMKANSPIEVTEDGISMDLKCEQ